MPKGGARARSGPAPDPQALRRDRDADGWLTLPVSGWDGDTPSWPLSRDNYTDREASLWARHWCKPQAAAWHRFGQEIEVALFVRNLAAAEQTGASVALQTVVRQQMESLGLTIPGMHRNQWKLSSDELAEERGGDGPKRAPVEFKRVK